MPRFRVYVTYTTTAYTIVEAENEDEAQDMVMEGQYPDLYGEESDAPDPYRAVEIEEPDAP